MTTSKRLFLSPPHMGALELDLIRQAFESNYIAPLGPMVDAFEQEFAAYTGIPHCLALSSGTAATHLALRHQLAGSGLKTAVPPGKEKPPLVIASTLTFIGSVTPATFEACELRFIDCDRETWNMDPVLLEAELDACAREGRRPAAVIPTDLYGQCCDLPRIARLCERYGVPVICDAAEAVGARYQRSEVGGQRSEGSEARRLTSDLRPPTADPWAHAGYDAWASVFSFNGNKIITTSGGGMLASHDKALIDHARKLSQQARDPAPWYEHTEIGFNYRMSNIVAAIGRGQLQVLDQRVDRKRRIFDGYRDRLAGLPGLSFMPEAPYGRSNRWLTVLLIDPQAFGSDTHTVREALDRDNIEARPVWKPMHLQPVLAEYRVRSDAGGVEPGSEAARRFASGRHCVSESFFAQGLCLPSGTAMSEADIDRVSRIIAACACSAAAGRRE